MAVYTVDGREYELILSIRAMAQIEKEYGDIKDAMQKFRSRGRSVETIKNMFRILANAGQHKRKLPENVTGDEIDDLNLAGMDRLSVVLYQCLDESLHAETVGGGEADDQGVDVYAEELEKREKNGLAGEA